MVLVQPVPMLDDNYGYLIIDEESKVAAAVDAVEPAKVEAAAAAAGVSVELVLTTHNHWDHAGGNEEYASLKAGLTIVGGVGDGAAGTTREVSHDDTLTIGAISIRVLATPCHTPGHVCYLAEDPRDDSPGAVFTGDTLFSSGCGKFNAGTPAQMHHALNVVLAKLPGETEVYNGHEYTVSNLRFARSVEPENAAMREKEEWAVTQIAAGKTTLPSTIANELATNPFMRLGEEAVLAYTGKTDPVDVIMELRTRKNNFRPPARK
uniref:hydroxyacylglutathione hydrolase n=1 Tax=Bicosoecida sp. CB-2014 TaxID=1486930 RepID=A0A7S1G503_9STRA|mmetsp:Transcript_14103/g.49100  ORF Transcript_14103/g.49100 Transcript_14103/m.49100 type:complete len:264 (+) Transcript_14103:65-856(+)